MYTDVQILNIGLGKITTSRISSITPPRTPIEVYCADNYPNWKRTELAKRRWVFALEDDFALPLTEVLTNPSDGRQYKYSLPTECLRPVRQRRTEWKQRGRFLYSAEPNLRVQMITDRPEAEFDTLFVEVLACWIGLHATEYVTQSSTKKEDLRAMYRDARDVARQANAFVIGPEDIGADDDDFSFLTERYNPIA